tara:strand:- start:1046 stop:1402 length:357 start_codon:yes stop_codon:yes gene_type:complete
MTKYTLTILCAVLLSSCGTLDNKTILIDAGDRKDKVLEIMGTPQDRQFQAEQEAWQYCVSGAGLGYNDHKIIWFREGLVTGITTYRSSVSGCTGGMRSIDWVDAPDFILETRSRQAHE